MKIGCVHSAGRDTRWPKFRWVRKALEHLGHRAIPVSAPEQLSEPFDLLLFEQKNAGLSVGAIREAKKTCPWAWWWFDLIRSDGGPVEYQNHYRDFPWPCFDFIFTKDSVAELRQLGHNAFYLDQGFPSEIGPCRYGDEFDVLMIGQKAGEYRSRIRDVEALVRRGFKVAWAGDGGNVPEGCISLPWTEPKQLPELVSRAKCCLQNNYRNDVEGYWSDRLWLLLGIGAVTVAAYVPGQPALPFLTYADHGELISCVETICGMTHDQRLRIGTNCREIVFAQHTYEHRLERLLATIFPAGL